jgi:transcriptional regulator with XRE-family HTH domain
MLAYSPVARKMVLKRLGITNLAIAEALRVDPSLVSHVLAGRRTQGPQGRRVMEHIAKIVGAPLDVVFPGSERRHGPGPRDPFPGKVAA